MASAPVPSSYPRSYFYFDACSQALTAHFTQPADHHIDAQASSSLCSTGGHSVARVDKFSDGKFISFATGNTEVSAGYEDDEASNDTEAIATVKGLNILNVVTADLVTAQTYSEHPTNASEGSVSMDLTTLSGDDTDERVRRLCAKARQPVQQELLDQFGVRDLHIQVGAVCVYHLFVETAVKALQGSSIPVAAVSTGFPAGLSPLEERIAEIRKSVKAGAQEIDVVITRAHAADRFNRRNLLLLCDFGFAVCFALLILITLRGNVSTISIYVVLVLLGVVRSFNGPVSRAIFPQLVPPEVFASSVAWGSTFWQAATILGPVVGGMLYAFSERVFGHGAGPSAVYACSLLAAFIAVVLMLRVPSQEKERNKPSAALHTVFEGFRYIWREKMILGAISLDLFAVLLGGAVALLPVYAREILQTGP